MNNDTEKVRPDGVNELSLLWLQENILKQIFRRQAMLTWRKNATMVAKTAAMMKIAADRHYVRRLAEALLLWRLYHRQRIMVNMFRDPYGAYQKWWLQGDLRHRFRT